MTSGQQGNTSYDDQIAELPTTWALTTLGEVIDYGKTEKVEPSAIPADAWILELEDVEKDTSRVLKRYTQVQRQSRSTKNRFKTGDVLYGKLRPYLNKVVLADAPGFCTTEIVPLQAGLALDGRYLFHWLKHPAFLKYVEAESHGMNMPRLGTEAGRAAPIVVAPRPEQTRVADQLDTLLARVQVCIDRLNAIPAFLKRFRQAVLDAALSGQMTEDWREAGSTSLDDWAPKTINDIAEVGTGSTPLRSNVGFFSKVGTPWVTSAATGRAFVDSADEYVTPAAIAAHRLEVYAPGTLLVAMYGEGKTRGQVSELRIPAAINQACAAISVDRRQASVAFVKFALWAQYEQMRALAEGGNQPNLNLSKVKSFPVQLPPEQEQAEIVRRVGAIFKVADRIEASHIAAIVQARRLMHLILAKAYRGELVSQDPNDEPASALLARIAAQRASSAAGPKTRQPRRPTAPRIPKEAAAMTKSRQDTDVMGHPYLADHLRRLGAPVTADALFRVSELPVADFYKQLAWEVAQGHVNDNKTTLEPGHAAG